MLVFDYTKPPLKQKFRTSESFYAGRKDCKIILTKDQHICLLIKGIYPEEHRNIILEVLKDGIK